jgi:hypothetical protein
MRDAIVAVDVFDEVMFRALMGVDRTRSIVGCISALAEQMRAEVMVRGALHVALSRCATGGGTGC